eukprot:m.1578748 g.1578748  ORF g.1578748 m.1578748 type:complete len:264 (-) comp25313_c0_seq8:1873-2664(-)
MLQRAAPNSATLARGQRQRRTSIGSAGKKPSSASVTVSEPIREQVEQILTSLASSDWKQRDAAITHAEELVEKEGGATLRPLLTKFFDVLTLRLTDSNSKVNKHALEAYQRMLPTLAPALEGQVPILNQIVNRVSPNLASKNKTIRDLSFDSLGQMTDCLDQLSLLQPFTIAAGYGSAKVKEAMIFLIADIVGTCFDANYKVSKRHVMPLLGQVLGDVKHKSDCARLCQALAEHLGADGVREAAAALPPDKQKQLGKELASCT